MTTIRHYHSNRQSFAEHRRDRSGFQRIFLEALSRDANMRGRVLDIGCGGNLAPYLKPLTDSMQQLDGLDPFDSVNRHPLLEDRWQATLEEAPIPLESYDAAMAHLVLEHVENPAAFLHKVHAILKPGGSFWGLTIHSHHPFPLLSRSIELLGLKGSFHRSNPDQVNDYPAYYRLCSARSLKRHAKPLGFSQINCFYYPCMQWDQYFPHPLRWAPFIYDAMVGLRSWRLNLIFMVHLVK